MSSPKVSVLMPVRNEERFLPTALASLSRQTLRDWELVVVNDGSTDSTPDILSLAARRDSRIQVISHPPEGLVRALNAGLQACSTPLVARMDGDDVCHPRRLERQLAFLEEHPEVDLVASAVRHFPRPALQEGLLQYEIWQNSLQTHGDILRDLFVESPFAHPAVMFRRESVLREGGYRETGWAEDYDLWLRMAAVGSRFARIPEVLFFWRDRPERLTRTAPHCTLEAFRACKAHHLRNDFLRQSETVTLWGAGLEGKAWRKALLKEGVEVNRWIDVDPRKIGQKIHGAPVIPFSDLRPGQGPILVTVGSRVARPQVRAFAREVGLAEGRDFVCVT